MRKSTWELSLIRKNIKRKDIYNEVLIRCCITLVFANCGFYEFVASLWFCRGRLTRDSLIANANAHTESKWHENCATLQARMKIARTSCWVICMALHVIKLNFASSFRRPPLISEVRAMKRKKKCWEILHNFLIKKFSLISCRRKNVLALGTIRNLPLFICEFMQISDNCDKSPIARLNQECLIFWLKAIEKSPNQKWASPSTP